MSTNHHTAIAANASAVNTTFNTPLGAIDAKLTHAVSEFAGTGGIATTVTTAGTFYAVTGTEVSFTPAYTGQVFLVTAIMGSVYSDTSGENIGLIRIVDSANATVVDAFIYGTFAAGANDENQFSGTRAWTAAAGDVGVTRKAKMYVSHSVNGSSVTLAQKVIQAVTH